MMMADMANAALDATDVGYCENHAVDVVVDSFVHVHAANLIIFFFFSKPEKNHRF